MAKTTPKTSESPTKETAAAAKTKGAKAKAKAKAPVKAKAVTEEPAPAVATKAKTPAKKVESEPAPKATSAAPKAKKAPTRVAEPSSDSQVVIHGLAEVVRLGLSAMDPDARTALLAALVKVGSSLAKS